MATRLTDRVALITGAGRGIGRAIAARFLEEGARVVIADSDAAAGRDAADELAGKGPVHAVAIDVAREAQIEEGIADAVAWGGGLHVLVNNAGIADPHLGPIEKATREAWQRVIDVNLTGPFLMAKHAVPHLRQGGGAIINVSSTRATMSEPQTEAYTASKGGLDALTHALANSLGPRIRVNAIAPGWIATDAWKPTGERRTPDLRPIDHEQHPVGRVGRPEDVAALAAYLASDEAGFVTGQVFILDGGMTRKMIYAE
jgi:NAD(P)-dependent dehydrogenase (short-subunit alcohol dehydrogenase family)